jgi:hypothetical protein
MRAQKAARETRQSGIVERPRTGRVRNPRVPEPGSANRNESAGRCAGGRRGSRAAGEGGAPRHRGQQRGTPRPRAPTQTTTRRPARMNRPVTGSSASRSRAGVAQRSVPARPSPRNTPQRSSAVRTPVTPAGLAAKAADGRGTHPVSFRARMPGSQRPRPGRVLPERRCPGPRDG